MHTSPVTSKRKSGAERRIRSISDNGCCKGFNYKIDNGTLKELRDYLYSIASLQVMNDDSEADINNFVDCKSND